MADSNFNSIESVSVADSVLKEQDDSLSPFLSFPHKCRVELYSLRPSALASHNFPGKLPLKFPATSDLK